MPGQTTLQGLFLAAVGLFFAVNSLSLHLGQFARFGPGLFPMVVSGALLAIALLVLVKSRFDPGERPAVGVRNIAIVSVALGAFVLLTKSIDMAAGIVALVFVVSTAGTSYSWKRNGVIAAGLVAVALGFERVLGLYLHVI